MFTAAVLTVSDSAFNKTREDTSGGEVERVLKEGGFTVVQKEVVPDDIKKISKAIKKFCKQGVNLVATTVCLTQKFVGGEFFYYQRPVDRFDYLFHFLNLIHKRAALLPAPIPSAFCGHRKSCNPMACQW